MTLDEAIARARDNAFKMCQKHETKQRGQENMQLAKWLEELKAYRVRYPEFKMDSGYPF